jgi:inosine-5'-monophosphate dehydrogenase
MFMIRLNEMAKRLNVSVKTLQRWDREGILVAKRTPTDRRYYTEDQYLEYIGSSTKSKRKTIAYVRVSSANQKDDLRNQITFIRNYVNAKGEILDDVIEDIGSGLNYNRKYWNDLLLNQIPKGEIEKIYITYKDRFVRFGFDWFKRFCNRYNCEIVVINNPDTSPQKELIDDLISIIHVFSDRINGLRKYKKDISSDESLQDGNLSDERTD